MQNMGGQLDVYWITLVREGNCYHLYECPNDSCTPDELLGGPVLCSDAFVEGERLMKEKGRKGVICFRVQGAHQGKILRVHPIRRDTIGQVAEVTA